MKHKKLMAGILTVAMATAFIGGCGSSASEKPATESVESTSTQESDDSDGVIDIVMWNGGDGAYASSLPDDNTYHRDFFADLIGVGVEAPFVEWNGGETYLEKLNLAIAAGEMPDIFLPYGGIEKDLIEGGALADLTDLLPEYAPHIWEALPEEAWDVMKTYDPSGEGRIYCIPGVINGFPLSTGLIRQDWLDALGLEMPTTVDEFVDVLRAFKTQDPNGNGVADEIPTGGRAEARWMDHLFSMFGVAIFEGYPCWDIYDGELIYSAVTPNMRDALEIVSQLYAEGLIDPETLLNDKAGWEGKVNSNQVGVFFHQARYSYEFSEKMYDGTGVQPEWTVLLTISAPGYEGFYTMKQINNLAWVIKEQDEEKVLACLKFVDCLFDPEYKEAIDMGIEGMHHEVVDGKKVKLNLPLSEQVHLSSAKDTYSDVESFTQELESINTPERTWAVQKSIDNLAESTKYGKVIAGDGITSLIYEGYPDIENRTLYVECASKIISGEWPIEKFDEFVDNWYASGGEEVTKAAREWYEKSQK